jgi:GNAT superfamily N-acetyltransferase
MDSLATTTFRSGEVADLDTLLRIDQDASVLFEQAGLFLELPPTHEFPISERARIRASLAAGDTVVALDAGGRPIGFAAIGFIDGMRYVEQLSVLPAHMRRGLGSRLLAMVLDSRADGLTSWLTTYDHLPWNRPFYERHGYVLVAERECGAGIRRGLDFQRRWLPQPERRIAMRRTPITSGSRMPG